MRTTWILALLLAFLPVAALASEQHKNITLDQQATIGNQQLKPGNYTLKFDDSTDTTTVNFNQQGKTVATAPAQVVHQKNTDNAQFEFNTSGGQNHLDRVWVNRNEELAFGRTAHIPSAMNHNQNSTPPTQ